MCCTPLQEEGSSLVVGHGGYMYWVGGREEVGTEGREEGGREEEGLDGHETGQIRFTTIIT